MLFKRRKKIVGLIGPSTPGGVSEGASGAWRLVLRFAAYRIPGEPITERDLRVEMPVPEKKLRTEMDSLSPLQIIEADIADDSNPDCLVIRKVRKRRCRDPDLETIAKELAKPILLETAEFGSLSYHRDLKYYSGRTVWNGISVELCLECDDPADASAPLETAHVLFAEELKWQTQVNEYAVSQLLALKNESWLEEGESDVTPEEFLARMVLETISIEEDGNFTFWHSDGDLFWGHSIQVSGNINSGPKFADIPG